MWRSGETRGSAEFVRFAAAAGRPGWCALAPDGVVLFGPEEGAKLTLMLDERRVPRQRQEATLLLPRRWEKARRLQVFAGDREFLGSPIRIDDLRRLVGCVEARAGALVGWAWYPADPAAAPELAIARAGLRVPAWRFVADGAIEGLRGLKSALAKIRWSPFARPRAFIVPAARLRELGGLSGLVSVRGRGGQDLLGSPLDPRRSEHIRGGMLRPRPGRPGPASKAPAGARQGAIADEVDVIVPVHDAAEVALPCLASVLRSLPPFARLIVVDDGSADPKLIRTLECYADDARLTLLRNARPCGFPAACNRGLRAIRPNADTVLLNSDTLVAPGWIDGLRAALACSPDAATATPFSNNATIMSYPDPEGGNPVPNGPETARLAALAAHLFHGEAVEIPTGVGFCLYIRGRALAEVGRFRGDLFAQGYGEETDLCLRARAIGWRHIAAPGVFVTHAGGASFGAAGAALRARNDALLHRLHPEYRALLARHHAADPLFSFRRRFDAARFTAEHGRGGAVILITHARGGGVLRVVGERAAALRRRGFRPIVLFPTTLAGAEKAALVSEGAAQGFPNLRFAIPRELAALTELLASARPRYAECHHLVGHDHRLLELCTRLRIPFDFIAHDYAAFCPRITLVDREGRYCETDSHGLCPASAAEAKAELEEAISPARLVRRSHAELARARRIIAPSHDAAARFRRQFPGLAVRIRRHENDAALPPLRARSFGRPRIIAVIGAIGRAKGYDVLLAAARDAAERDLPLRFVLVGYSMDDAPLLETERVFVTGPYREGAAAGLIEEARADLAFLPSIWPETWCFTLTEAWRAGLGVAAFDLGAQAERIGASRRGWLLPPGLAPRAVNDALLALVPLAVPRVARKKPARCARDELRPSMARDTPILSDGRERDARPTDHDRAQGFGPRNAAG